MRSLKLTALVISAAVIAPASGQPLPDKGKGEGGHSKPKPPPDEFRSLVKEIEEAYKAPLEVDEDIRDELRKQYRNPTPERELKIFREIRRLYRASPAQEEVILREIRRAYDAPSAEQELRIFQEIRRGGPLPLGTVPVSIQAERAEKLFRKLDQDGDGLLQSDEMPDVLRDQRDQWDASRDGRISVEEYGPYYQSQLKWVSDRVAVGDIPIKLPKAATVPENYPDPAEPARPVVVRAGDLPAGLPEWFRTYDLDRDGQVGLYEWKKVGQAIAEFVAMDANRDGFLLAEELSAFLAEKAAPRSNGTPARRSD